MSRRLALTIIVNLLILGSAYCLLLLINRPDEENDQTTKLRFTFLLGVHGVVFIWMLVIMKI
jgi:apolipoprotein N-acyltransferase